MFWKIYAVIYLVIVAVGLPPVLSHVTDIPPIEIIDMVVFAPISVAALWSAAYRHISLPKFGWHVLLFGSVFWRAIAVGNALMFGDRISKFHAILHALSTRMNPGR